MRKNRNTLQQKLPRDRALVGNIFGIRYNTILSTLPCLAVFCCQLISINNGFKIFMTDSTIQNKQARGWASSDQDLINKTDGHPLQDAHHIIPYCSNCAPVLITLSSHVLAIRPH